MIDEIGWSDSVFASTSGAIDFALETTMRAIQRLTEVKIAYIDIYANGSDGSLV